MRGTDLSHTLLPHRCVVVTQINLLDLAEPVRQLRMILAALSNK